MFHLPSRSDHGGPTRIASGCVLLDHSVPDHTLARRVAQTWCCVCGHVETHPNPGELRAMAKAHVERVHDDWAEQGVGR